MKLTRIGGVLSFFAMSCLAVASTIGVGLDWRKNIFIQEYWKDGKVSYSIANKTGADQVIVGHTYNGGKKIAGPWNVKANSLISEDVSSLIGKDLVQFDLEGGDSLGLMDSPVAPAEFPKSPIVSYYGLNGSGGRHNDVWVEQDKLVFPSESIVELRLRIPGSKGQLIVKKGDLPNIEVSCKTLKVSQGKDDIMLDIENPITAQDAHIVVLKFKAPKADKTAMLTVDTWLWDRGKNSGHGITRGVVIGQKD